MIKLAQSLCLSVLVLLVAACESTIQGIADETEIIKNFIGNNKPAVSCAEPEILNENISTDLTLNSGCYLVTSSIVVRDSARFEILPNSILLFQSGTSLSIDGGNIIANGTEDQPIYFSSDIESPGSWIGINIKKRNPFPNSFQYVVIEYAGIDDFDNYNASFAVAHQAGDNIFEKGKFTFSNNVIRNSGSKYAMYIDDHSNMDVMENNTIYSNRGYPIYITPDDITLISESNRFQHNAIGNDINKIDIDANRLGNVESINNLGSQTVVWKNLGIPYLLSQGMTVNNTHFVVEAGAELQFASGKDLQITRSSSIALQGTIDQPVRLTGEDKIPGFWSGLVISGSDDFKNRITYTEIEYGGNINSTSNNKAGLNIAESTKLSISNSTISHSAGFGFVVENDSQLTFNNNRITENVITGRIYSDIIKYMDSESDYTGNNGDYIEILTGSMTSAEVWPGINAAYLFHNNFNVANALTIEAGATLLFAENKILGINGESSNLKAIGEPDNPITFSSKAILDGSNTPEYWRGIYFRNSHGNGDNQNILSNVNISYSGFTNNGETELNYGAASIRLTTESNATRPSFLEIENLQISNLDLNSWGIFVDERSTLLQQNTNQNNIENGICKQISSANPIACQ